MRKRAPRVLRRRGARAKVPRQDDDHRERLDRDNLQGSGQVSIAGHRVQPAPEEADVRQNCALVPRCLVECGSHAPAAGRDPLWLQANGQANAARRVLESFRKFWPGDQKNSCASARFEQITVLPNTHVPVVVCRSAGIWTRGQLTVLGRPAAGGEPAYPAQRGTRLEATTDRAFLVSASPPKAGDQRGLSILPGVRTGTFLVQTVALNALEPSGSREAWLRLSS